MKERPILFSGPMVRAILEGRKTMTRRVVKHVAASRTKWVRVIYSSGEFDFIFPNEHDSKFEGDGILIRCPYGMKWDRLWVRETWMEGPDDFGNGHGKPLYKASFGNVPDGLKWRPSIYMPRWASRIDLEITGVRVERLHDITDADALSEGACFPDPRASEGCYRAAFEGLWMSINGRESWNANPWVWVIEFKRI